MTAEERSALLQQQSAATLLKSDTILIKEVLRKHGGPAVAACKRALVQLGFVDSAGVIAAPAKNLVPPRPSALAIADDAHKWDEGFGSTWGGSKVKPIIEIMARVDPVALSENNIRRLGKKHSRDPPRAAIFQLFTFVFNLDYDSKIPAFGSHDAMAQYLQVRYCDNGERALSSPLPIDYPSAGVYALDHRGGAWFIVHRFTKQTAEIGGVDDPAGARRLFIEHNYSDTKATMRDLDNDRIVKQCCMLVSSPLAAGSSASGSGERAGSGEGATPLTSPPTEKRRRLALLDRFPGSSPRASPPPGAEASASASSGQANGDAAFVTPKKEPASRAPPPGPPPASGEASSDDAGAKDAAGLEASFQPYEEE